MLVKAMAKAEKHAGETAGAIKTKKNNSNTKSIQINRATHKFYCETFGTRRC